MTKYDFNVRDFDIRRGRRRWERDELDHRLYLAPEKIEFIGGIFAGDRERLLVLGMILEIMGIDTAVEYGRIEDWKAAIADREERETIGKPTGG
jgi:hypothetical protein